MESTTPSHRGGTKCGAVAVTMGGSPVRWLGVGGVTGWPGQEVLCFSLLLASQAT